ncbi:MAG: FAD-binding oxidoreductase [Deltaproteobacteria bacterium]|nr:FAD-binding oxidoreductase [Deltaproteobacteria bacterium]
MPKRTLLKDWVSRVVGAVNTSFADTDRSSYGELHPDVVAWPGSVEEISSVLQTAHDANAEVAVAGSGSRTRERWPKRNNGKRADDQRPRIVLDTSRLTNILEVDETSQLVECQTGLELRHLEEALRRHGLTLGPFPDSIFTSTLGGVLGDPPPLAYSSLRGPLHGSCLGVTTVTPLGNVIATRVAPRRAVGPDISRLYIGSGATLGVLVSAVIRVYSLPETNMARAFLFPSAASALECAREMLAHDMRPARLRVMANEHSAGEVVMKQFPAQAALTLVFEGCAELVELDARRAEEIAAEHSGSELPQQLADHWAERYPDPNPEHLCHAWAPVRHSTAVAAGKAAADVLGNTVHGISYDQFSPHGCHMWLSVPEEVDKERLAEACTSAGLSPRGRRHTHARQHPLTQRLRQQLDPTRMMLSPEWD